MEELFERMKKAGKTDVETIIKWLKESKIIDGTKVTEEKARALFADAKDKHAVELSKFKEAVGKLAADQNKSMKDVMAKLAEEGPKVLAAALAAAQASKK